jgi:hypothetical protein
MTRGRLFCRCPIALLCNAAPPELLEFPPGALQRVRFARPTPQEIVGYCSALCAARAFDVSRDALEQIARRRALSDFGRAGAL